MASAGGRLASVAVDGLRWFVIPAYAGMTEGGQGAAGAGGWRRGCFALLDQAAALAFAVFGPFFEEHFCPSLGFLPGDFGAVRVDLVWVGG